MTAGRPASRECGTPAAYRRHLRRGETPCGACRAAWAHQVRAIRRKRVGLD